MYSSQKHDSIQITYDTDSTKYYFNKYLNGGVIFSGIYFSNTKLPYMESFINQDNKKSIDKSYFKNGVLQRERIDVEIGKYILRKWDNAGNMILDSIRKINYENL